MEKLLGNLNISLPKELPSPLSWRTPRAAHDKYVWVNLAAAKLYAVDEKKPEHQRQAFEQLVNLYSPQLYRQIRRMVYSHDDTNDILLLVSCR